MHKCFVFLSSHPHTQTNAGSIRWLNGFEYQPFSASKIRQGRLEDSLLPIQGYSTQELSERKEKEEQAQAIEEKKREKKAKKKER